MKPIILNDCKEIPSTPKKVGEDGNGRFTFIYRGEKIEEVRKLVERENVCLRIFKQIITDDTKDFWWGFSDQRGSNIAESTHIQNVYAHYNLAPRVYKIFQVIINGNKHWAGIVDDLGHFDENITDKDQTKYFNERIKPIAELYNITIFNDGVPHNIINDKYVDFQGFRLPENYEKRLKDKIYGIASKGKWGPWQNYQEILGLPSGRKNEHRIEKMSFNKLDFKNKSVLDIGCSEGIFCHYAESKGASKIVGIDLPQVAENLWELASYLGFYNCDFYGYDLKKQTPDLGQFDIVLFLSMGIHVGFPDWILKSVKELLVYEGNSRDSDIPQIKKIEENMKVTYDNFTEDLFKRRVIWAQKK